MVNPVFKIKKSNKLSENSKWKIFKIAQENQAMLKRLHDSQSCYDVKKFEEHFRQNRAYKRNISDYPSTVNISNEHYSKSNVDFYKNLRKIKLNSLNKEKILEKYNSSVNVLKKDGDQFESKEKILFIKKILFQDLYQCLFKFYLESEKYIFKKKDL